jgi:hypothetical protein
MLRSGGRPAISLTFAIDFLARLVAGYPTMGRFEGINNRTLRRQTAAMRLSGRN